MKTFKILVLFLAIIMTSCQIIVEDHCPTPQPDCAAIELEIVSLEYKINSYIYNSYYLEQMVRRYEYLKTIRCTQDYPSYR
jgi:hypothetical protein